MSTRKYLSDSKRSLSRLLTDFYAIRDRKIEKRIFFIIPLFIMIAYFVLCYFTNLPSLSFAEAFFNDLLNSLITVTALFITFSMGFLTILLTSASENVINLHKRLAQNYSLNGKSITTFQVILAEYTYLVSIEVVLLCLLFIQKILLLIHNIHLIKGAIAINIFLFTHMTMILIRNIKNVYYTFWKAETNPAHTGQPKTKNKKTP